MVFIQFKKSETNSFTVEANSQTLVTDILTKINQLNNIRVYLDRLIWSIDELANKGILKPTQLQSISYQDYEKSKEEFADLPVEKLQFATKPIVEPPFKYVPDKSNLRQGLILPDEQRQILLDAIASAKNVMAPRKETAQKQHFLGAVEKLRQAVMTAYPAYIGLPEWQPSIMLLQQKLPLQLLQSENFQLYDNESTVWWAGKQLDPKKPICDYAGKNQKTRIIVKVQKKGGEKPTRQPPVDKETYQQMVKYYYKKVEQNKQFDKKGVESHYENIKTDSLKQKFHLENQIIFKPF